MTLTRRHALLGAAALPLAAPALLRATPARAQMQTAAMPVPLQRTIPLGTFQVTSLLAGSGARENPQEIFGLNVDAETFATESAENFIPADRFTGFFQPALVVAGENRILFDTGMNAGGLLAALAEAGLAPADVTHVVLTHMHPDHIGGLRDDAGAETFANAAYVAGQAEFDHWAGQGNELFDANVRPLAERMTFLAPGQEVAPGIVAVDASGHTPGMLAFQLESEGQGMMITADTANHYVWSLANPDWEVSFDADKAKAAETRRRILGQLAADRLPSLGYHMPAPGIGYVEADGEGFRWVPMSYQFM